jgi:hypothetical protein
MQAPKLDGFVPIFIAGTVVLGAAWFLAPAAIVFVACFIALGLSLPLSKLLAVWACGIWVLGHGIFWLYIRFHDWVVLKIHERKHEDFMRIRDIFYYSNATCAESYEALKERERNWLDGKGSGRNMPDSPLRCESELRDEVGSWLEFAGD